MNRKKIFGIGAIVLLLLISVTPVINGSQLEKNIDIETLSLNVDYSAYITKCELAEISLTEDRVNYKVNWKVCRDFVVNTITLPCTLYEKVSHKVYADLKVHFDSFGPAIEEGTIDLWLKSSEDPLEDEERHLAGNIIVFEINFEDINTSNNVAEEFVKYWMEDSDYTPTEPQVEVSAPRWGNQVYHSEIPDLYYVDIFGGNAGRILSNILLSKRMGWVGQALRYFAKISLDVAAIFGVVTIFLISIRNNLTDIGEWFLEIISWFWNLINGNWIPGRLWELMNEFKYSIKPTIEYIAEKGKDVGDIVRNLTYNLSYHANETYNWMLDDPWTKDIKIDVHVNNVQPGERVQVDCRTNTSVKTRGVDDGVGMEKFTLNVSSEAQGNEKSQEGIHNCRVIVNGDMHDGEGKSRLLLSFAYANGSLYWYFPSPNGKTRERDYSKQTLSDKIIAWLKNNPILSFLEKLLGKNRIIKVAEQETSTINRGFDLDALVKGVLEEEKQYEPYNVEYKEYYLGAPPDPNIVYYGSDQVVVGYKSYVDVTTIDEVEGYPVVDKLVELNTVIVEIYGIDPEDFMVIVNQSEDVEYTELNFIYQTCYTPNDPLYNEQWGLKAINCPQAWDIEKGSTGYGRVTIIDTGCNYDHEDIRIKTSSVNYDFVNNDDDPMDDCYVKHGTHCAGVVGATMNNGKGIAGVGQVHTSYIKVLDSYGAGYASNIAKGIVRAANIGVDVISMSLGGYGISVMLHLACNYAYYIRNTLIVAAAGNDGLSILCYPARFESVISVGAVDKNLKLCSWSNHGPNLDLVAPGDGIISTVGGNSYGKLSGTSMATPHVAGVAALVFSYIPYYEAVLCRGRLISTATDLGNPGKDWEYGYGLVNAYGAVKKSKSMERIQQVFSFFPWVQHFLENLKLWENF